MLDGDLRQGDVKEEKEKFNSHLEQKRALEYHRCKDIGTHTSVVDNGQYSGNGV